MKNYGLISPSFQNALLDSFLSPCLPESGIDFFYLKLNFMLNQLLNLGQLESVTNKSQVGSYSSISTIVKHGFLNIVLVEIIR